MERRVRKMWNVKPITGLSNASCNCYQVCLTSLPAGRAPCSGGWRSGCWGPPCRGWRGWRGQPAGRPSCCSPHPGWPSPAHCDCLTASHKHTHRLSGAKSRGGLVKLCVAKFTFDPGVWREYLILHSYSKEGRELKVLLLFLQPAANYLIFIHILHSLGRSKIKSISLFLSSSTALLFLITGPALLSVPPVLIWYATYLWTMVTVGLSSSHLGAAPPSISGIL